MELKIKNKYYNFDVDKIVNYLRPFKDRLPELYVWATPTEKELEAGLSLNLFNKTEFNTLMKSETYFERNALMKSFINSKLTKTKDKDLLTTYYMWIIKDWGGIRGIKSDGLYERIETTIISYNKDYCVSFEKISSTTKAMNFISPEHFIIYDSRVAFALNWIMLKTNASSKYFAIPQGRNSKLGAFDMLTLIRLKNIKLYKESYSNNKDDKRFIYNNDKTLFIDEKHCYHLMNELFKEISQKLWHGTDMEMYPYYTEMLLFAIADTYIFEDILNSY